MTSKNLWGDLGDIASIRTPHEILLEQGTYLSEMTEGLLEIEIERRQKNTLFTYEVFLSVTKMKFKQCLLRLTHDIKLYPAILHDEQNGQEYNTNSQEEFEDSLGAILSSSETRTVISGLMAQARLESDIMV